MQILNLFNPLTYKREDYDFNSLLIKMLKAEKGSDSFILYSISFDDSSLKLKKIDSGFKTPLSQEEKDRIESGLSPIVRDDEDTSIPSGKYYFEQYPDLSEEQLLSLTFSQIAAKKGGNNLLYVRLYKENTLELVMQAFRPCML